MKNQIQRLTVKRITKANINYNTKSNNTSDNHHKYNDGDLKFDNILKKEIERINNMRSYFL